MRYTLSSHPFLTPEECSSYCSTLHLLKDQWINTTHGFLPLFKLEANERFQRLYDEIPKRLSQIFKMPALYHSQKTLPKFFICQADEQFKRSLYCPHYDFHFREERWDYQNVDYQGHVTFVLLLSQPKEGCSLRYWDVTHEETEHLNQEEFVAFVKSKQPLNYPLELGKITIQEGLFLHQTPPAKQIEEDDERIVLQGHALKCDGTLRIY